MPVSTAGSDDTVTDVETDERPRLGRLNGVVFNSLERARDFGVLGIVLILFITLAIRSSPFLTTTNQSNILDQWAPTGIVALAGTIVLISGGFDLSVAAVYSITGVTAAKLAGSMDPQLALLMGILCGLAIGFINGVIVVAWKVNSIIATLATSIIIGGLAVQLSGGNLLTVADPAFSRLGNAQWGITLLSWVFVVMMLGFAFLLHRTTYGRRVFAVGGNREAARLAGIRTGWVLIAAYSLSGLAAGVAGVIVASRQSTGQANALPGLEFDVIAAIIVGGTSILGGAGAIWRTVVGLALLALIQNGANLLGIDSTYQRIIYGAIILGAAALDVWARRRTAAA